MIKFFLEIKCRFILLLINGCLTIITSYFYKETILFSVLHQNVFLKNKNEQLKVLYFIFTDVTEILLVYLKLVIFLNIQIIIFYLFYHVFLFVIPALFKLEYLNLKFIIKAVLTVYLLFIILFNCFILPITLDFFLNFQLKKISNSFCLHFEAKLIEYLKFYIFFYYSCMFYCQFFTLFYLFLNCVNVQVSIIKKFRKLLCYCFLTITLFLSPPEIITQFLLFLNIFLFYEFIIIIFVIKLNLAYLHR